MRSSLTRNVFRAVIANEPYCITTCSRRLPKWRRRPFSQPLVPSAQCRSLFGLSAQPAVRTVLENKSTPSNVERARDVLVGLVRAQRDQTQLPSVHQIVLAFNIVLQSRNQVPARLSRSEIYLLTEGFRYIQDHKANDIGDVDVLLSDEDLQQGLSLLASSSGKDKFRSDSKALAFMLFSELRHRIDAAAKSVEAPTGSEPVVKETYISVLSSTGGAREAWEILTTSSQGDAQKNWLEVIKGLVNEGLEQDVWKALCEMKTRTGDLGAEGHEILTIHFARNASIYATKKVYGQSIAAGGSPTITSQVGMARFCIRNEELSWAEPILANLWSIQHDPRVWDVILVSSAAQGGSVDQIAAMMDYLAERTITTNTSGPTMSNVNSLIEYAYSVGDIHAVQDYINCSQTQRQLCYSLTMRLELVTWTEQQQHLMSSHRKIQFSMDQTHRF
jgi:hypothetical protein